MGQIYNEVYDEFEPGSIQRRIQRVFEEPCQDQRLFDHYGLSFEWIEEAIIKDTPIRNAADDGKIQIIDDIENDIRRLSAITKKIETEIQNKQRQIIDLAYPDEPDQEQ